MASVLGAVGLSDANLADLDRFLDVESIAALFERAAAEVADDAFGLHVGGAFDVRGLGVLSYVVLHAPTVDDALRNLERHARAHMQGPRVALEVHAETAQLTYASNAATVATRRHHVEAALAIGTQLMRRLLGPAWRPRRVLFEHGAPGCTREHARFFVAPVHFAQSRNALVFDSRELRAPVSGADARLLAIVERHLREIGDPAPVNDPWLETVREAITQALGGGAPTIHSIAKQSRVSVRSLQRRLSVRGIVFRELVAGVRRDIACRHLHAGTTKLTQLAFLLGYSDLSAFQRAFRQWTGQSPSQYLRRHCDRLRGRSSQDSGGLGAPGPPSRALLE